MIRVLTASAILSLFFPAAAEAVFVPPEAIVRKLSPSETRRKDRIEAIWARPASIPYLAHYKGDGLPSQWTEVRLAYDDANLYVAFRCLESRMDKLVTEYTRNDDKIWRDDSVSVFLDTRHNHKGFFHMTANTAGTKYDEKDASGAPDSWNGEWTVHIEKGKTQWRALMVIPFSQLAIGTPRPGTVWGANFGRHERVAEELSCWSPVISSFHEPGRWGHIVFGTSASPIVTASVKRFSSPGKYPVQIRVSNPTQKKLRLRAEAVYDGRTTATKDFLASSGDSTAQIFLLFPEEGSHTLNVSVRNHSDGKVLFRTPLVRLSIAANRTRLARYRAILTEIATGLAQRFESERSAAEAELRQIERFARTAPGNDTRWEELGRMLDSLERKVHFLRFAAADRHSAGYVIGTETALKKILRDRAFDGGLGEPARISLCRNEYEAVQAVVIAYDRDLQDVSVTASSLRGPRGAVIGLEHITLNLVGYVKTRKPRYEVDFVGWWPDPLLELTPFDLARGSIQPIWITVHTPKDVPAGIYRGKIFVRPANAPESSLPIEVTVWDVTLPDETHLKTAFALFPHEISAWYGQYTEEMRRSWYGFLLDHRINPTNIYSRTPLPEKQDLEFCIRRGLNAFNLAYVHNFGPEQRAELVSMIRDYEVFLKEKGWWERAYIYGFDEIQPDKYGELRDMYGFIKREFPDLPRACTVVPNKELKGYVDIWVPVTSNFDADIAAQYRKSGDEIWWYVCCNPHHPYANFFIDYPAIDQRIIFWMNWKYGVTGFLYYALNLWETNRSNVEQPGEKRPHEDPAVREAIRQGKRWPEVPWNTFTFDDFNGDGHLIYPGPGGKPCSSIRFECIRDGIEDYEMFWLLSEIVRRTEGKADRELLARARRLLAVREYVVRSLTDYTLDPKLLLAARQEVAEMIEKLTGPGQPRQ